MKALEETMRSIEMDGLTWGAGTLVPLAFGIKKLQVNVVVEDEKVSIDDLQGKIEEDEEHVQSTDVVRFFIHTSIAPSDFPLLGCNAETVDLLARCGNSCSQIHCPQRASGIVLALEEILRNRPFHSLLCYC